MLFSFPSVRDWLSRKIACRTVAFDASSLTARVSYELRSSLNGIVGYAEFLENKTVEPMMNFTAQIIRESGSNLTRACNSYFDLQHVQSGQICFSKKRINFQTLIQSVFDKYQLHALERSIPLRFFCEPEAESVSVLADEIRLRQVLYALVFNAIEMAEAWDVIDLHLYWHEDKNVLKLIVQSTQTKLDRKRLSLLEEFWNTDNYQFHLQEGPGVEMAMAKSLIRLARISAKYEVNQDHVGALELLLPTS